MSEFDELQAQLAHEAPQKPRPGLRDEVLAGVHRELHPMRLGRLALAATILIAAVLMGALEEAGHRRRVAAIEADSVHPRVSRTIRELSPGLAADQLRTRLRLLARRKSDLRWAGYVFAIHESGENHG